MAEAYKITDQEGLYFLTFTTVDWVDVFTNKQHKLKIVDSLKHCQRHKGLIVYAYCLMSHHLHLIAQAQPGHRLSDIIRDFKKFTAKAIIASIEQEPESRRDCLLYRFAFAGKYQQRIKDYKLWQDGYHAKALLSNAFMQQKLDYIHQNPVEALIVDRPEDYLFSSARNYAGLAGTMLEVSLIE
ncbi:MAG: transposase [Bacteroidota bacterium]